MHPFLRTRLCIHMFLSGAIVGAWQPLLVPYLKSLGFSEFQVASAYATGAIAMIVSPIFFGQIADRHFASEKLIALTNLGAGFFLLAGRFMTGFPQVFGCLLGGALLSMPTFPLGTAVAFHHLPDGPRQFPGVRVWGTIGWIGGAWLLSAWLHVKGSVLADCLAMAGMIAIANAAWSLLLPHTPPRRDVAGRSAIGKAVGMLRDPSYALFSGLLFLLSFFAVFYFARAPLFMVHAGIPEKNLSAVMSVGQVVEIAMVFLLPAIYLRLGAKATILLGIAAWVLRFALFATGGPMALLILALALHGVGFACGRIGATIYVDRICDRDARASAQSLLSLMIDGAGPLLGNYLVGAAALHFVTAGVLDWRSFWIVPAAGCGAVLVGFLLGFHPRKKITALAQSSEPSSAGPV